MNANKESTRNLLDVRIMPCCVMDFWNVVQPERGYLPLKRSNFIKGFA